MLFSEPNKREPYRPDKYRSKTALENDSNQEEGLFGDEFEGDISNDPLEDLVDHAWAVDPNEDQVVNFEDEPIVDFEEEYEREDPITNTASRTSYKGFPYNNLQEQPFLPGHKWPTYLYRGLTVKMPSDMEGELDLAVMEGDQREIYRIGKKVLNIISSKGMGRHWTTEPDIAMDFAQRSAPNGNLAVVLSVVWERDGEDLAAEHEGYDGVVRPSRLVGEEEVTLERGTRIKVISMKASRVGGGTLYERNFELDLLDTPQTKTASQLVANDGVLDSLNPTGTIFTEYNPQGRASLDLAPNIAPYSETSGLSPDDRVMVYRGVPKGVQSELADGDFITDMEQLAKDYAGTGDVISQEVFADEILDDLDDPMAGEYLFRPRRASKKMASEELEEDDLLDTLNPTGSIFVDYDPDSRASKDLAPNIVPYSETAGISPDERLKVYRGVPKGVQSELADGDFITDMRQLAEDYAGYPYGDVITQYVFADEVLDDNEYPMSGEYLFRPRRASKKTAQDYFMEHRPAGPDFGSPLHDLNDTFPDIYESPHYYDFGEPGNKDSFTSIQRAKGNPEEMVTMYRSIPSDGNPSFAPGDWVSTSGDYARQHSLSDNEEDDDFIVMEQQVPASALWSEGNSVAEWGYHGDALDGAISEKYTPKKTLERLRSQKSSSRRVANEGNPPGNIYRGIGTDSLTREEYDQIVNWAQENQYDPENFTLAEPNYEMIYPILERLEEEQGLGRHWSTDYDVAKSFAGDSAWENEDLYWDEENKPPLGIVFRGDWGGDGEDFAEFHKGYDGIKRPSNLEHEKEVTLHPGSEVNLLGIDVFEPGGDVYDIPVPDIPVYASKRREKKENSPGNIYRGIGTDMLTQEEYDEISSWADQNEYDPSNPDSFTMVQPNYDVIQPILERLEEQQGLGRHWSKDHNVAVDFAGHNSTYFDSNEEENPPLGIVFRGDWVGEGEDLAEEQPGYDGVVRPSNWHEEKEVTLHPGSEVNLLGIDVFEPGGDFKNIPVPDIPVYSRKKTTRRKKEDVTAVNRYLRFANRRGLDPKDSRTSRSFRRASRGLSPRAMTEISSWMKAQKTAGNSARRVLANTRSYRHKMASGSWYLDNKLSAYVSKTPQKFACSCGSHIAVPSYTNCKCGKVWNAYKIHSASQGDTTFVVREVPVRENVLVANRRTASRRRNYR